MSNLLLHSLCKAIIIAFLTSCFLFSTGQKVDHITSQIEKALANKQYALVIKLSNEAISIQPKNGLNYFFKGTAYYYKGNLDLAIKEFTRSIQLMPDYSNAYVNRGLAYRGKDNYERAIKDYSRAIELSDAWAAYHNRAYVYFSQDMYGSAILDYTKAIQKDPIAEDYYWRGLSYYNENDYDLAIQDFTKAIEIKPDFADSYNERGNVYLDLLDFSNAIQDFSKAIQLDPDSEQAYSTRGRAYKHAGDYDKSIQDFTKVIQIDPDYNNYNARGYSYIFKGSYDRAIKDFYKSIELRPQNGYALFHVLPCLIRLHRFTEASSWYNRYIRQINAGVSSEFYFYKLFLNAVKTISNGNYKAALVELENAEREYTTYWQKISTKDMQRGFTDVLALKGYVLEKLKLIADAETVYMRALEIESNQPDVKEGLNRLSNLRKE